MLGNISQGLVLVLDVDTHGRYPKVHTIETPSYQYLTAPYSCPGSPILTGAFPKTPFYPNNTPQ